MTTPKTVDSPPNTQSVPRGLGRVFARNPRGTLVFEGTVDALEVSRDWPALAMPLKGWPPGGRATFADELSRSRSWVPGGRDTPWWDIAASHGYSADHVENLIGLRPVVCTPWEVRFAEPQTAEAREAVVRAFEACQELLLGYTLLHGVEAAAPVRWWARVGAALPR